MSKAEDTQEAVCWVARHGTHHESEKMSITCAAATGCSGSFLRRRELCCRRGRDDCQPPPDFLWDVFRGCSQGADDLHAASDHNLPPLGDFLIR